MKNNTEQNQTTRSHSSTHDSCAKSHTSFTTYDGLALFSGGLDSILAARLLMEQGKKILCLHFTSPFFGDARAITRWEKLYGVEIIAINIDDAYCDMLLEGGKYGYGSVLNPCIDCKIIMMQHAKKLLKKYNAKFLVSGEVLGQRPMSQRRDTLNVIKRDAGVKDILLRPLCAKHMEPLPIELSGEVDRSKLLGFSGRGRKEQLALAKHYGLTEIPTAAGGCMLTEKENARRYWTLMQNINHASANDFHMSNFGRQLWYEDYWLIIGRKQADNEALMEKALKTDYLFKVTDFAGPLAVGRKMGTRPSTLVNATWSEEELLNAASLVASYSNKALKHYEESKELLNVRISHNNEDREVKVIPVRASKYTEPTWQEVKDEIYALRKVPSEIK